MKKRAIFLMMLGMAVAGIVGCQAAKNPSDAEDGKQAEDSKENKKTSGGREEKDASEEDLTAEFGEQQQSNEGYINSHSEEIYVDDEKNYVTYYGCPNSKRIAKLNTKKNLIR